MSEGEAAPQGQSPQAGEPAAAPAQPAPARSYIEAAQDTTAPPSPSKEELDATFEERFNRGRQPQHVYLGRSIPADICSRARREQIGNAFTLKAIQLLRQKHPRSLKRTGCLPFRFTWHNATRKDKRTTNPRAKYLPRVDIIDDEVDAALRALILEFSFEGLALGFLPETKREREGVPQPPTPEPTHVAVILNCPWDLVSAEEIVEHLKQQAIPKFAVLEGDWEEKIKLGNNSSVLAASHGRLQVTLAGKVPESLEECVREIEIVPGVKHPVV